MNLLINSSISLPSTSFKKALLLPIGECIPNEKKRRCKKRNRVWDHKLRKAIACFVLKKNKRPSRFIFSSELTCLNGVWLGMPLDATQEELESVSIYDVRVLADNTFKKIEPVLACKKGLEKQLGISLDQPYVLCQTGSRKIIQRSTDQIAKEDYLATLAKEMPVILLDFDTKRNQDSFSQFAHIPGCRSICLNTFPEQSCLIHFAQNCLFFTEGDFRSHIYVPPFLGRDVHVIVPQSVLDLGTAPVDFWNQHVFLFGGQIFCQTSEAIFSSRGKNVLRGFLERQIREEASSPLPI